jgi:prepilin-type N-terminal cleavage/methylation domain-containing protein
MQGNRAGFSLLELIAVVSIMAIATAMAVPVFLNARRGYQLRTATVDLAGLLQRSRISAVQSNSARGVFTQAAGTQVYFDSNGNGAYDRGEPMLQLPANITQINAVGASAMPAGTLGFNNVQVPPARFNGRGMPCTIVGGFCTNYPAAGEVGFVYYLNQNINGVQRWAAVSVTPAGQVKTWALNNGVWANW